MNTFLFTADQWSWLFIFGSYFLLLFFAFVMCWAVNKKGWLQKGASVGMFLAWVIFTTFGLAWAADTKLSALTATTTPAGTDIIYIVVDPGGTPVSRKTTVTNFLAAGNSGINAGTNVTADLEEETHATEHAISGADPLDSISEGNTNVETTDSGTGQVDIDVDGEQQVQINDGNIQLINGLSFHILTTTSGHKYCLGAYDVDGEAWADVLCFENANTPTMELQSGAQFSGLGPIAAPMKVGDTDADGRALATTEMDQIWISSGAGDWVLPDVCDSATGEWVTIINNAAHATTVDVADTSDDFILTDLTNVDGNANDLDLPASAWAFGTFTCVAANTWLVTGENSTGVADGGAE